MAVAGRRHLHHDDTPAALAILSDLLDHRAGFPEGYEPTEHGAWVDWDALDRSWLSSTEKATLHIARGCAIAERHGGLPLEVAGSVRAAVEELAGGWTADPGPVDLTGPDSDAYSFAEPVGLDPYHPDGAGVGDRLDECDGPAWRYILTAQRLAEGHRRAQLPEAPEAGPGVEL